MSDTIGPYDSDFKRGRFNPKVVLAFILIAIAGGFLAIFALKNETCKMTADEISAVKKNIYVLPKAESRHQVARAGREARRVRASARSADPARLGR